MKTITAIRHTCSCECYCEKPGHFMFVELPVVAVEPVEIEKEEYPYYHENQDRAKRSGE